MTRLFFVILVLTTLAPRPLAAQACCAGASAVTPGRLGVHEDALAGLRLRVANVFGSWSSEASYAAAPPGSTEWDFEEDLFAAIRLTTRAQLAALVPAVETYRSTPSLRELGGGMGDVNMSGRYDFTLAGESRWLPGIAGLAGITFPTGTAVESASRPLATDATGVGAYQGNLGVALEQITGPWLFGVTGLAAKRAPRTANGVSTSKSTEWTLLAAAAYTFPGDESVALSTSYVAEGDSDVDGRRVPASSRRLATLAAAAMFPLGPLWRLQGSAFVFPPLKGLGQNALADTGMALTLVYVAPHPAACPPSKGDDPTMAIGPTVVAPF